MNLLSDYFEGRCSRTAAAYATIIVEAQHPKEKLGKLSKRYDLNYGTMYHYRNIRTGKWSKDKLADHLRDTGIWSDLVQDSMRSRVLYPKDIKDLLSLANDVGVYPSKKKEKQPEIQPLDFVEEKAIAPDYNPTPPTEEQQQSNRMSVFFGFMLGIVAMLLFILVERGTL